MEKMHLRKLKLSDVFQLRDCKSCAMKQIRKLSSLIQIAPLILKLYKTIGEIKRNNNS